MNRNAVKLNLKEFFLERFQDLESSLNGEIESSWHQTRRKAMERFEKVGLPGSKDEEYKYTPISKRLAQDFEFKSTYPVSDLKNDQILGSLKFQLDGLRLVFVNGSLRKDLSILPDAAGQVEIMTLGQAMAGHRETFETHFARYADFEQDPYAALNTGLSQEGCFILIGPGQVIKQPISLYFVSDGSHGDVYNQPRNLILVGPNSQVRFTESFETIGTGSSFTNSVTEIVVEQDARVEYYKVQDDEMAYQVDMTQVRQATGSYFAAHTVTLKGQMVRNNLNISLDGEHCESHMNGLYLIDGEQHVDNHTKVDHTKPNSFSNELYKGVMDGKSNGVFNGKIFVRPGAQKTNAYQSNANILISDEASMNTKPQLEIWADDVKCSHGATTGQLDNEQLFYLRSRGLSKESAQAMLLYAFAREVVDKVEIAELREYLDQKITQNLNQEKAL